MNSTSPRDHDGNYMVSTPNGIRTRAATLKGWCPRPLDDGGRGLVALRADAKLSPPVNRSTARCGAVGAIRSGWLSLSQSIACEHPVSDTKRYSPRDAPRPVPGNGWCLTPDVPRRDEFDRAADQRRRGKVRRRSVDPGSVHHFEAHPDRRVRGGGPDIVRREREPVLARRCADERVVDPIRRRATLSARKRRDRRRTGRGRRGRAASSGRRTGGTRRSPGGRG